ncbi:MAG: hypothetical protein H7Z37_05445 [Pyrinomonadaceae bacterium]|nr:hypothetical protein [Pyrinomonadaceae bacterium]
MNEDYQNDWINDRSAKYREFFNLGNDVALISDEAKPPELSTEAAAALERFNIEWHFIPTNDAVPVDDDYLKRFYPTSKRLFAPNREHQIDVRKTLVEGHKAQQGIIVGIETTEKPNYLPENRQFYGTQYGHDATTDPFAVYFGQAEMTNGTRFDHDFGLIQRFLQIANKDMRERKILPEGYQVKICPPAIFNLIGTVFHQEWSATQTLELGFYYDERGNATSMTVGANAPNDFSFIDVVEGEFGWALSGFRLAIMPESPSQTGKK